MAKKDKNKVVVLECQHPLDQAFDQPREDGSDKWDKICGLCGITMCEVVNPALSTEAQEISESSATEVAKQEVPADGPSICANIECFNFDPDEPNRCNAFEHVYECDDVKGQEQEATYAATQEEAETAGPETGAAGTEGEADPSAALSDGLKEKLVEHANRDKPESYITRDPDFIGPTFTRSLPVPVPDEELAELAKKMSHTHGIWCKAKLDAKAAAKGFKGITDRAEEEMVQLAGIIEEGTEDRPTVCRWEFDYAAGVKKLRRLDNHQIVDEETLEGDELHMSFNFNGSSEAAVEQLAAKQAGEQDETEIPEPELPVGNEHDGIPAADSTCPTCKGKHPNCDECCSACMKSQDCLNSQFCTLQTVMDTGTICAVCVSADCGTHEPTGYTQDCTGFAAEFSTAQITHNDGICKTWRACEYQRGCFSEQNEENGDCLSDQAKEAADEAKARDRAGIQKAGILADADELF